MKFVSIIITLIPNINFRESLSILFLFYDIKWSTNRDFEIFLLNLKIQCELINLFKLQLISRLHWNEDSKCVTKKFVSLEPRRRKIYN